MDEEIIDDVEVEETESEELTPEGSANETEANDSESEETEDQEEIELFDVEIDGVTHKLPAEVKKAVMLNADYTQKTTSLSHDRNELATMKQRFQDQQSFTQEHMETVAQVHSLNSQLKDFESVDWAQFQQQDPDQAQQLFMRYQQLKDIRDRTANDLNTKQNEFQAKQEQELANLKAKSEEVLSRDISDWSPVKANELNDFAASQFGFSTADLQAAQVDPRIMKLINMAQIGFKVSQKTKPITPSKKAANPVTKITGKKSKVVAQNDKMGIDDWMELEMRKSRNG